jgi:hypothetical protein
MHFYLSARKMNLIDILQKHELQPILLRMYGFIKNNGANKSSFDCSFSHKANMCII